MQSSHKDTVFPRKHINIAEVETEHEKYIKFPWFLILQES